MIGKGFSTLIIILFVCGTPFTSNGQSGTADLTFAVYGGGAFLPGKADHLSSSYYEDLKYGLNFGAHSILFFGNLGIGFTYDQSNFAATGERINSATIDEDYRLRFFGPSLASKVEINSSNQLIFTFSYGKSISRNKAIIDGNEVVFENDEYVPKLAIFYEHRFSDFSFNAALHFINEKEVVGQQFLTSILGGGLNGISTIRYDYISGTNFDRLSLTVGLSYQLSGLF